MNPTRRVSPLLAALAVLFLVAGRASAGESPAPAAAPGAAGPTAPSKEAPASAEGPKVVDGEDVAEDDDDVEDGEPNPEIEDRSPAPAQPGLRYTADLSDAELERLWNESPEKLGSLSVGFADAGRVINGQPFPNGPHWKVSDPPHTWGTSETVAYVKAALEAVTNRFSGPPVRVSHFSKPEGGYLRPHRSHQSGRDVDFAFFELPDDQIRGRNTLESRFDVVRNWALVRSLVTLTDVQLILVDRRVQKRLYDHALSIGEDRAWLDSLFKAGKDSLIFHARRHRDHFHARFFNPRAQELGRRVQPLLGKGKHAIAATVHHRVRPGDCLGSIARKYGATIPTIRRENALRGNIIRAGMVLVVPLRGPCTKCPLPPEVVVPPRRLPPTTPEIFSKEPAVAALPDSEKVADAVGGSAPAEGAKVAETTPVGTVVPLAVPSAPSTVDTSKAAQTAPAGTSIPTPPAGSVPTVASDKAPPSTGGSGAEPPAPSEPALSTEPTPSLTLAP